MKTYSDGLHRLTPEDWRLMRDVRLRSLQDSPSAFGSTYARERDRDESGWRSWLSTPWPKFVATQDGRGVAIGGGYVDDDGTAHVIAMWTAPEARRQGYARAIVEQIIAWAETEKLPLELRVTTTNRAAREVYLACGFEPSGIVHPLRDGSDELAEVLHFRPAATW